MSRTNCPYCNAVQKIANSLIGSNGDTFDYKCKACSKYFLVITKHIVYFESKKTDCLNGHEHNWVLVKADPIDHSIVICQNCNKDRMPTREEIRKMEK